MNLFVKDVLLSVSLGLILFSCEKEIDFNSELIKPQIVVKSIISPGTGIMVIVEKSRSILDDHSYFEALPNAKVSLFANGEFLKELQYVRRIDTSRTLLYEGKYEKIPYENGAYQDTLIKIKAGASYRLEVSCEGFKTAKCETTVPLPVDISGVEGEFENFQRGNNDSYFRVNAKVKINDPANEENFYELNIFPYYGVELASLKLQTNGYGGSYYGNYGSSYRLNLDSIQPTDTIVLQSCYMNHFYSIDPVLTSTDIVDVLESEFIAENYFSDELFEGREYTLSFWVETNQQIYTELGEYYAVNVSLDNLSKELYKFYNSVEQQGLAIDNPFAEPVPVYSNVEGGLGIFGSNANSYAFVIIGDYPVEGKTYIDYNTYREMYEGVYYNY